MLPALAACGEPQPGPDRESIDDKAKRIAAETIIIDTHIDVPYRIDQGGWQTVTDRTDGGDFDYFRAVEGGLNAPFMSIYTPAPFGVSTIAKQHAETMIAIVERMAREAPERFRLATSVADVEAAFADGVIALPLGMENGSPIGRDLANLDYFHGRGIRYITLTHSKPNQIADSSYDENKPYDGLSPFGEDMVRRMNTLGIMVDVSHVSDAAFWDVMAITQVPVIASHSSARHFTPGFERNMSDDMIKALADNGGVIMINFGSSFLTEAANTYRSRLAAAYETHLVENGLEASDAVRNAFSARFQEENPYPFAGIDDVLDHIDHVVALTGVETVGIGSDYDGVGDSLPVGLKDVSYYPNLITGLLQRGYSEADIKKILSGNLLRVWRVVEAYAAADTGPAQPDVPAQPEATPQPEAATQPEA